MSKNDTKDMLSLGLQSYVSITSQTMIDPQQIILEGGLTTDKSQGTIYKHAMKDELCLGEIAGQCI